MKVNGITVKPPEAKVIVIPHNNQDLVFKAQYVDNYDEFDEICPRPTPYKIKGASGSETTDLKDPEYLSELHTWASRRTKWMFIKSLEATDRLEWSYVDPKDPETWDKFDKEFQDVGFSEPIIESIKMLCIDACGLSQSRIDEATERFLAGQARESESATTPSSEA
jgi:hypothetical protein